MDYDVYHMFLTTISKYSRKDLKSAIFHGIKDSGFAYFTRSLDARGNFLKACQEDFRNEKHSAKGTHRLLKNYVQLAVETMASGSNEYDRFNTNTALNYALLSTYKQRFKSHHSKEKALEETTKVLEDLIKNGANHFSTKQDGSSSAYDEIEKMLNELFIKDISPADYFSDLIASQFSMYTENELLKARHKDQPEIVHEAPVQRSSVSQPSVQRSSTSQPSTPRGSSLYAKKVFNRGLSQFRSKVLNGQSSELISCDSIDRNLFVAQSKGNRSNQEDSCLICKSDTFPGLNFMVVCDGMGGLDAGEKASQLAVEELKKWFSTNEATLSSMRSQNQVAELLNSKLREISHRISVEYGNRSGCTCVCALTNKNGTFISNVGDSRAYAINNKGKNITQITKDHSMAYQVYYPLHSKGPADGDTRVYRRPGDNVVLQSPDDLRFYRRSNEITQYLGMDEMDGELAPDTYYLPPHSFDKLILCSDGVSDLIGTETMLAINNSSKPNMFAQKLVEHALTHDAYPPQYLVGAPEFVKMINRGKDNTTATVLIANER